MSPIRQDLRLALQPGRRGRIASFVAVVSLALGIAGNSAVFSLANAMVFRPLPYPDPERLVLVGQREKGEPDLAILSVTTAHAVWADYRERSRTLTDWAAMNPGFFSLSQGDRSVSVQAAEATPSLFRVLGGRAVRGRLFTDAEAEPGGPGVAVLSWEYWRDSYGLDADPIGDVLTLDGQPYEVIGVVAEGFEFITARIDLWLPMQRSPYSRTRGSRNVISVARMAPGVTMAQVDADVAAIAEDLEAEFPDDFRGWTMDAINLGTEFPDPQSRLYMALIQGSVLMVLLIACANISILLLARGHERRREIAIRTALGAGRARIFGQLVRESMAVAALGGFAGLLLAAVALRLTSAPFTAITMTAWTPSLDVRVLLFTLIATVFAGLTFGLVPAVQTLRRNHADALKAGGGGRASGVDRALMSRGLVIAEVAISLVALGVGSVLALTLLDVKSQDPGFEANGLMAVRLAAPTWKYEDRAEALDLLRSAERRADALDGVAGSALVSQLPVALFTATTTFEIEGQPSDDPDETLEAAFLRVSPDYLTTLEVHVVQGRFIEARDGSDEPLVCVISRTLAERRFSGQSPIGDRITVGGRSREIVGVADDVRQTLVTQMSGDFQETIYVPLAQDPQLDLYLVLRTSSDSEHLAEQLHAAIWSIDPDLTVYSVETIRVWMERYLVAFETYNTLFTTLGILALLLASLGTYGVVAAMVSQRRHEIGVRIAVGALPGEVVSMVAVRGLLMSLVGVALGAAVLIPVQSLVRGVLVAFGMRPTGGGVVVVAGAVLLAVTVIAALVPASRAARVDPVEVLKAG